MVSLNQQLVKKKENLESVLVGLLEKREKEHYSNRLLEMERNLLIEALQDKIDAIDSELR